MARPLLTSALMRWILAGSAAATSCVIPPNVELDEVDGGAGSRPAILSSGPSPDFAVPGPIVLQRADTRDITLTAEDHDLDDVLYVRMFVNYPEDIAVRAECQVAPTGTKERIIECPTRNLCDGVGEQDTTIQFLEAMIADQDFLPDNHEDAAEQDPNRAVPSDALYSWRGWMLTCAEAN